MTFETLAQNVTPGELVTTFVGPSTDGVPTKYEIHANVAASADPADHSERFVVQAATTGEEVAALGLERSNLFGLFLGITAFEDDPDPAVAVVAIEAGTELLAARHIDSALVPPEATQVPIQEAIRALGAEKTGTFGMYSLKAGAVGHQAVRGAELAVAA